MEKRLGNKGLSPVIATVFLVALALILAIIIFLWAKSFIGEKTEKFGRPVEYACEDVDLLVDVYIDGISVENRGNVPIYGINVLRKLESGRVDEMGIAKIGSLTGEDIGFLSIGETGSFEIPSGIELGDNLILVPVILGESGENTEIYICDAKFGIEEIVKNEG